MQLAVVVALPRAARASDILLYKEQRRGMGHGRYDYSTRRCTLMSSWALGWGQRALASVL